MTSFFKPILVVGALIAGSIGLALPAQAQVPGSYQDSCRNISVKHANGPKARLIADCRRRDGSWNTSKLDIADCRGDISNDNGNLVCARGSGGGGGGGGGGKLPGGSWRESCRDGQMLGDRLLAKCQRRDGGWATATIRADKCRNNIANDNGKLVCGDIRPRPLPRGSWQDSCRDAEVRGDMLYAECRQMDGKWRDTSIGLDRCRGDIANMDGRLRCN